MNATLELLRMIGSPFASGRKLSDPEKSLELYNYSMRNKTSLLYLSALKECAKLDRLKHLYEQEYTRYLEDIDAIAYVSQVLTDANIEHAVYKTFRPYEATTVDIDVLIFEPRLKYRRAIKNMQNVGCKILGYGPRSTTLYDPRNHIAIDLYQEVAVSLITYLDKEKLAQHVTSIRLPNGKCVKALTPEADLLTIVTHSVIKEHMYLLSEYYTAIYYITKMNIDKLVEIAMENNITSATTNHIAITVALHQAAHKKTPRKLQLILDHLGNQTLEISLLRKRSFKMPHKYHLTTVVRSLLEIAKAEKPRRTIALQLLKMLRPEFVRRFIEHITRETY